MKPNKFFAIALSWFFGAIFFAGLNLYLLLKKITKRVSSQSGPYKATEIGRFRPPIELGSLPGEINPENLYHIPGNVPGEATCALLEISILPQDSQLSAELEFTVTTGKNNQVHFFLFLKPFENKPELSYATEEVLIDIPENRKFKILFEGPTGMNTNIKGKVKIIGYC